MLYIDEIQFDAHSTPTFMKKEHESNSKGINVIPTINANISIDNKNAFELTLSAFRQKYESMNEDEIPENPLCNVGNIHVISPICAQIITF